MKPILGISLIGLLFGGCSPVREVTDLLPENVEQIEIFPSRWERPGQPPDVTIINQTEAIAEILAVLTPQGEVSRSGMVEQAKMIVIEKKTGRKILLQLQPGSDTNYYQYMGLGKAFRIPRKPFLEAMKKHGVDWLPE